MPAPAWQLLWYVWPDSAREAARRCTELGRAALDERRFEDAVGLFGDALAAARHAYGRDHARVVEPLSGLAAALVGAGREEEAPRFVTEVLAFVDRGGFSEEDWLRAYRDAADLHYRTGRVRAASALWQRIEARFDRREEHAARVAEAVWHQALAHRWLFDFHRMRELVARLPESWTSLRHLLLGRAAYLEGDHDLAIASYESLLTAMPAARGYRDDARQVEVSADGAIVCSRLALAFHAAGRTGEARRARARAQHALDHIDAAAKERALAVIELDDGEMDATPASALGHFELARALRTELDGPNDPSTIEARVRVAELHAELGDHAAAHAEASALRSVLEKGFGRAHPWARRVRALAR